MLGLVVLNLFASFSMSNCEIDRDEAKTIVAKFLEISSRDQRGQLLGPPLEAIDIKNDDFDEQPNEFAFWVNRGLIAVNKINSSVTYFAVDYRKESYPLPAWNENQMMPKNELIERANYYWQKAGHKDKIIFRDYERWMADAATENMFNMYFTIIRNGISLHPMYMAHLGLEHVTGRLCLLSAPIAPKEPIQIRSIVDKTTAFSNMISYLGKRTNQSLFCIRKSVSLVSWAPRADDLQNQFCELTTLDKRNGEENQGVWTYWAEIVAPLDNDHAVPTVMYWVNVNASDGRVFGASRNGCMLGDTDHTRKPLWLEWESGESKLVFQRKTENVLNSEMKQTRITERPQSGKELIILRGNVVFLVVYDSTSGLIWAKDGKVWKGAKPSENLKKAIEKLVR